MLRSVELTMELPTVVFSTMNRFDDYSTDDMQCGDLNEAQILSLGIDDVSERVDPYRLLRFDTSKSKAYRRFDYGVAPFIPKGIPITREECKSILFDEMRGLSTQFAHGQYANIIKEMIDNFQYRNGASYSNHGLDKAFSTLITQTEHGHALGKIKTAINDKFVSGPLYDNHRPLEQQIRSEIYGGQMHKFNRSQDNFNGLGITIHDIHAQEIRLESLRNVGYSWSASVRFKAQDHFGLDKTDITSPIFKQFRFFRIWFFLQRHKDYAFKPFFTNFSANIDIHGEI